MDKKICRRTYLASTVAAIGLSGCLDAVPGVGSSEGSSGFENGGFEEGTENGEDDVDLPGWDVEHSNTHYVGIVDDVIDGRSLRTKWKKNSFDADPASVSQDVDLTDASGVRIDAAGKGGYPYRNKIILEVDGEEQGTFVEAPEKQTEYLDREVEFTESFEGTHTVTIKWVQISGDNLGGSFIDNVRLVTE